MNAPVSIFESRLAGGHPNSLGNTIEVVEEVLSQPDLLDELFKCYESSDEVVRLRTSNGIKRICKADKELILPYMDRLLTDVAQLDQPSAKWTLAQLFLMLTKSLTEEQKIRALEIMKANLEQCDDWIVQNMTMETIGKWALRDAALAHWLIPRLKKNRGDHRKSVASKASRILTKLDH